MARGDADFRLVVDAALSEMFANGDIERIYRTALPGVEPGTAIRAMFLTSPILP
jgi:polar amino acid transport system substrate-binding protein/glutamate/aspartate transport system substrate-binding protein